MGWQAWPYCFRSPFFCSFNCLVVWWYFKLFVFRFVYVWSFYSFHFLNTYSFLTIGGIFVFESTERWFALLAKMMWHNQKRPVKLALFLVYVFCCPIWIQCEDLCLAIGRCWVKSIWLITFEEFCLHFWLFFVCEINGSFS